MAQQWYSIVEYAREFSISDMTVRRRIKTGKLNAVLKEGKYYIPVEDAAVQNEKVIATRSSIPAIESPVNTQRPNNSHLQYSSRPTPSYQDRGPQISPRNDSQESYRPRVTPNNIPSAVMRPIGQADSLVMKADQLISYCDRMLNELQQTKSQNRELYEAKIKTLEAKLAAKEVELQQYRQQVEDLQVLVKILENKQAN